MPAVSAAVSFWDKALPATNEAWLADAHRIVSEAEPRRAVADYDTGSILPFEAYLLRALAEYLKARVVIEVGTFIGTSTCALASASSVHAVYTCDISNDCLPSQGSIVAFPKARSVDMLRQLVARWVRPDLCFFDGVLTAADIEFLTLMVHDRTVFAVHDYNYGPKIRKHGLQTVARKGIGNARLLQPRFGGVVVDPLPDTTIALLVPEGLL